MSTAINLLPASYRQRRRRDRRFQIGLTVAAIALSIELLVGIGLHVRAGTTRGVLIEAERARESVAQFRQKIVAPAKQVATLQQQLAMARKLRTTHAWSRLLATLADLAPERVMLNEITTNPPKWTPPVASSAKLAASKQKIPPPAVLIKGVTIRGCAMEHSDLAEFLTALGQARPFATVTVKEARRDTVLDQPMIAFELECEW